MFTPDVILCTPLITNSINMLSQLLSSSFSGLYCEVDLLTGIISSFKTFKNYVYPEFVEFVFNLIWTSFVTQILQSGFIWPTVNNIATW